VLALDAEAFGIAALLLGRLQAGTAPPVEGTERALTVLRDHPYAVLTLLNARMLLYMPLLSLVFPGWIAARTNAPTWLAAAVLDIDTICVILFQTRVAHRVTDVPPAARTIRTAGLVMLATCGVFPPRVGTVSPWLTCAALVTAALLQVLADMLQAAGSWELSFGLAPAGRYGLYQGMYSSGIPLARVIGPAALNEADARVRRDGLARPRRSDRGGRAGDRIGDRMGHAAPLGLPRHLGRRCIGAGRGGAGWGRRPL
jgi:hypothetical protein